MESMDIFQFVDRTLCPKIAFCIQYYSVLSFPTAYYSVYGVNLYNILNRTDYLYLKVADLVKCLALQQHTARSRLLKLV